MLSLIEAPIEDKTCIAFVTEPVEFNLATLLNDKSKSDLIPSEIDLKCLVLELMEVINFLHANAKSIHCNISPEHVYVTKTGKLKIAGLNFLLPFTSADPVAT
jgi:SCY1-like protein 2